MTKREYSAIALGVLCFVLLSALLSTTTNLHQFGWFTLALMGALEVGWYAYAPIPWRSAHSSIFRFRLFRIPVIDTDSLREFAITSTLWLFRKTMGIVGGVTVIAGIVSWIMILAEILPAMDNWLFGWTIFAPLVIAALCITAACSFVVSPIKTEDTLVYERSSPKEQVVACTKALGVCVLGSLALPLIAAAATIIIACITLWLGIAIIIGTAVLASEAHFLVVTIGIVAGSVVSLLYAVSDLSPITIMLRILIGAAAGFAAGEITHRAGQFFTNHQWGRSLVNVVFPDMKVS